MTATHPSAASGLADRMALLVEDMLVATSPEGILGRLCSPLFWVLGKLMERRMRREMEKLVAILREIATNGLPALAPVPVEPVERATPSVRAGGADKTAWPGGAQGAWEDSGIRDWQGDWSDHCQDHCQDHWQDRADGAGAARDVSDTQCVAGLETRAFRVAPGIARRQRQSCNERPAARRAFACPSRVTRTADGAHAFGPTLENADGGRARRGIVPLAS